MFHHHAEEFKRTPMSTVSWVFRVIRHVAFHVVIGGILLIVLGFVIQYLWNWLMPGLFSLKTITFWQALGLTVLSRIFFAGVGWHGGHGHHEIERHAGHFAEWKNNFDRHDFKCYGEYWKNEGEGAFKAYVEKMKNSTNKPQ